MQIFRNINDIKGTFLQGVVLTIGDFDGFHLGHQSLVASTVIKAKELNIPSAILIFEPQAREFFDKFNHPCRLNTLREKISHFEKSGIDNIIIQSFNKEFAAITAENFIKDILVEKLQVKKVIVGYDFKFGNKRTGDFGLLEKESKKYGFSVEKILACTRDNQIISSSLIRDLLFTQEFDKVEQLLGRKYSITAKIDKINNIIEPRNLVIASLFVHNHKFPIRSGIYKVHIHTESDKDITCIVHNNLGSNPKIYIDISLLDHKKISTREIILLEFGKYLKSLNIVFSEQAFNLDKMAEVFTVKK